MIVFPILALHPKKDNTSIKRDDSDKRTNQKKKTNQIDNVENQEQGNGNNTHPLNNVNDHVYTSNERTYLNQIEPMQIDNPQQQLTHPTNNVHTIADRTYPN